MVEWVPVCTEADVAEGQIASYRVGSRQVAVARLDGELFAFDDDCPHEECPLSDGYVEEGRVVCACHGAEFDLQTGEVLGPPATEPLAVFEVRVEDGQVRVGIEE